MGRLRALPVLLADAGHNLGDVLGLLLAWGSIVLSKRVPTERRTYGLRRSTTVAALFNALILVMGVGRHRLGGDRTLPRSRLRWRAAR